MFNYFKYFFLIQSPSGLVNCSHHILSRYRHIHVNNCVWKGPLKGMWNYGRMDIKFDIFLIAFWILHTWCGMEGVKSTMHKFGLQNLKKLMSPLELGFGLTFWHQVEEIIKFVLILVSITHISYRSLKLIKDVPFWCRVFIHNTGHQSS